MKNECENNVLHEYLDLLFILISSKYPYVGHKISNDNYLELEDKISPSSSMDLSALAKLCTSQCSIGEKGTIPAANTIQSLIENFYYVT